MVGTDDGRAFMHSVRSAAYLPSGQSRLVFGNTGGHGCAALFDGCHATNCTN